MNLAIDIGNSSFKAGVYDRDRKIKVKYSGTESEDSLAAIMSGYVIRKAIISTVKKENSMISEYLSRSGVEISFLNCQTPLPFRIEYRSPSTLGTDRIAAVAGAYNLFPGLNVLNIDAGTAITYDLLEADGNYPGGNISPGLDMRFRALHDYTGRLPLLSRDDSFGNLGVNTENAIRSGVQSGLIFEINDYIRNLKKRYRDLKVILTGGDCSYLDAKIDYEHITEQDLVINGLNYILNYNA